VVVWRVFERQTRGPQPALWSFGEYLQADVLMDHEGAMRGRRA
jgi:hypothetical protein